jgi:hypothetical protein
VIWGGKEFKERVGGFWICRVRNDFIEFAPLEGYSIVRPPILVLLGLLVLLELL